MPAHESGAWMLLALTWFSAQASMPTRTSRDQAGGQVEDGRASEHPKPGLFDPVKGPEALFHQPRQV